MAEDQWGQTALHYLAQRKRCVTIEVVLKTMADRGECMQAGQRVVTRLNVNAINGKGQTFLHILLQEDEELFAHKLLCTYMDTYKFNCDLPSKD